MRPHKNFRGKWWQGIKFRLFAFAILMSILPLLILAKFNLSWFSDNIEKNLHSQHALLSLRVASEINRSIAEIEKSLEVFSVWQCRAKTIEDGMHALVTKIPIIEGLTLVDISGKETTKVSKYDYIFPEDFNNIAGEESFKAISKLQSYYGDVELGGGGYPVFTVAIPLVGSKGFEGGILALASFREIMDEITRLPVGEGGYVFLINKEGQLIGHQDFSLVLNKEDVSASFPPNFYDRNSNAETMVPITRIYRSYNDLEVIGTYMPLGETNWSVIIEQPMKEALASFNNLKSVWYSGTALIIFLVLGISFFFGIGFTKELEKLALGVRKLSQGELGYQIEVTGDDEIGNIVKAFNKFSIELKEKEIMERALAEVDKMAAIGLLASGVAHEVNNPLGTVYLITEDLQEQVKEIETHSREDIEGKLGLIQEQIMRCKNTTQGLLGFSRKGEFKQEKVSINELLENVVGLLEFRFKKQKITVQMELAPNLPDLYLDGQALQQVLFNIISNSIDAMNKENGIVEIQVEQKDGWLIVKISDNGSGIKEEELSRVFEPFYTTKPSGEGTGLGLAICYGIVTQWGGTISINSSPDWGTEVIILLPLVESPPIK